MTMSHDRTALDDAASGRLLQMMFADLREQLSSERGRRRLAEHYGADACVRLSQVVDLLIGRSPPTGIANEGTPDRRAHGRA